MVSGQANTDSNSRIERENGVIRLGAARNLLLIRRDQAQAAQVNADPGFQKILGREG